METRFFFYTVKALDEAKSELPIGDLLKAKDFVHTSKKIPIEDVAGNLVYEFSFTSLGGDFYYGEIIRTRSGDRFYVKPIQGDMQGLQERLEEGERVGETENDIVRFLIHLQPKTLTVLMQVGFRTAGMGRLKILLEKLFGSDVKEVTYVAKKSEKVMNSFKLVHNKKIKEIRMKFRKNPELPPGVGVDNTIKSMTEIAEDIFYIDMTLSLGKIGANVVDSVPLFNDIYKKLFGREMNPDEIDIDFPAFLSSFEVATLPEPGELSIEEDLIEAFEKVSINIDMTDTADNMKTAKTLLEKFKQKLGME